MFDRGLHKSVFTASCSLRVSATRQGVSIDPEWAGVDEVIEFLAKEKESDFSLYSLANSTSSRSIVAWPNEKAGKPFKFLSAMD